jgi:hypothetical protein
MQPQQHQQQLLHHQYNQHGRGGLQYDGREDNEAARQQERELEQELQAYAAQQFAEAQQQQYMQMQQQFAGLQQQQQQPQLAGWDPPPPPAAVYANQFQLAGMGPAAMPPGHDSSKVICIAEHCPPPLWKPHW